MKLSFVELYNEELYDLLSQEENSNARVKIFDDKDGKLQISGMEEKVASTLQDALRIFDHGTKRRSTTETLMNRESSRSHSVFIMSIFMQESGIENTGIVKCGKLNLVDLAGSENISKSGVTDKQKREASNINQSLLTLGRVINMLSTGANTYIPYRDSKLTRILKDSLGGKTKTSMIATVSPNLSNLEETISTLEYAHQSKNIKNRPEINRKVTQNAIHKNMTHELQKLQRDLEAQRSKSGVYVDQDNFNAMQNELSENCQKLEEQESLLEEYRDENRQFHSGLEKCLSMIDYYEPKAKEFYRNIEEKHAALENFAKFYNIDLTGFYNRLRNILPKNAEVFDTLCRANKRALPQFREFFDLLADDLKCFMAKEFQIVKKSIAGHEEWPAMMQCNLQSSGESLRQKLEELQSADSKFHSSHLQFLLEESKQNSESVKKAEQCRDSLHAAIEKLSKSFLQGCNSFLDENSKCVSSLSSTCDNQNRQNNQLGQCIPAVQRLIDDYQTKVVEKIEGKLEESERRLQGALATIDNLKQELTETCSELACLKQDASRQWSVFKDEASTLTNMQLTSIEDSKHSTSQLQIAMNRNKAIFHEFSQSFMPVFVQQVEEAAADLQRSMQAKVIDRMTATGQAFDNQHTTFQSFEAAHQGQVKAVKTRCIDELTSSIMERLKRQPEVVIAEINAQQSRLDKFYASVQNALKSSTADLDKLIDEYYRAEKNHQALNDLEYPTCSESNKENTMPPALASYTSIDPDFKEDELRHLVVKPMCDKVVKYEAPPQGAPSDTKDESVTTNVSENLAKKSKITD
ncbi:MAG: Kinesin-related protein 11 [Marteilia pararefringens]